MGDFADTFSFRAAGEAREAAKAADSNLNASLTLLQMVSEMRDWETGRFNEVIRSLNNRAAQMDDLKSEINDLKAQVAGLQNRLYNEQKKDKGITR